MQEQGKRILLAVTLGLGVFLVWNQFAPKEEPPPSSTATQEPVKPATSQVGVPLGGSAATPAAGSEAGAPAAAPPAEELPRPAEETLVLSFDNVEATFSSYCGGLKSWRLSDKRYKHDATRGQLLPEKSLMTTTDAAGKTIPVPAPQLAELPACGALDVNFASSTFVIPRRAVWKGEQISRNEIRYTYSSDRLEVVKTFTVVPESFLVRMAVKVNVHVPEGTEARQQLAVTVFAFQNPAAIKSSGWFGGVPARAWVSSTMRDDTLIQTDVGGVIDWPRFEPVIQWTGFEHPYLLVGFAPRVDTGDRVEKHTKAADGKGALPRGFMQTDLLFSATTFKPGDASMTKEVIGYLGPKNYYNLEQADVAAGFTTGFHKVVDLGWFAFIGRPLLWLLQKFHELAGNWGISIVLLTFLVKLLTLYWTTKSMRSMKAMAALAPQLKVLQAKYGDDKQRQQAETMALYKQHNVNPIAGCLPILLQMPIWIALYRMLSSAGELYQQPLIPGWIDDLTASDPIYVLPAVLVVTMFVQARLQPATADSRQQKFLQYGMPLMFGVMSFFFPAGLTLYIFTNTVLSALHSIYMNKFDRKSLEIAAQLKKTQDPAAAALAAKNTGPATSARNGGPAKAKRALDGIIDAKATEVVSSTKDGGGDTDDDPAATPGTPGVGVARNRPRRKKRRR